MKYFSQYKLVRYLKSLEDLYKGWEDYVEGEVDVF